MGLLVLQSPVQCREKLLEWLGQGLLRFLHLQDTSSQVRYVLNAVSTAEAV
jgi:hypothetical protein